MPAGEFLALLSAVMLFIHYSVLPVPRSKNLMRTRLVHEILLDLAARKIKDPSELHLASVSGEREAW